MIMNEVCSLEFPVVIRQNGSLLINSIYYFLIHARMKNSKREAMESAEIVKTYLNNIIISRIRLKGAENEKSFTTQETM